MEQNQGKNQCGLLSRFVTKTHCALTAKARALFFVLLTFGGALGFSAVAQAASIGLSPSAGVYATNNNFTVSIVVNTNQEINAVEGLLQFPTSKLEVISVSKKNSLLGLWVDEPTFSNAGQIGKVHFSGVRLNPGFNGNNGVVLDVTFRVKDIGLADVTFGSASILANDGHGTNLLTAFGSGIYTLRAA